MLRVSAVAKRLDCSEATVYALIEKGILGHHRCPGVRVSEEQITEYLDKTRREPAVKTQQRKFADSRPRLRFQR
jgi:excisionase family DNA binding protein